MDDLSHFYQVLGLKAGATHDEVKLVYRDLVKVWHPDRFSHDDRLRLMAQEKLKEINGAYKMLEAHFFDASIQPEATPAAEGAPIRPPPEAATEPVLPERNKTVLVVIVILLVLGLAAAGAFILLRNKPILTPHALSFEGNQTSPAGLTLSTTGSLTGTFTVECWAMTHQLSGPILSSRQPKNFSFEIIFRVGKRMHIDLGDGSDWCGTNLTMPFIYKTDQWYHVACVVTPTGCILYMNEKKLKVHSFDPPQNPLLYDADHVLSLGSNARNTDYLDGCLAEVRVWNTARSEDEIKSKMYTTLTGNEPGLQGYWPFKEGSGTNTADASGHGFNGQLTGNISWSTNLPLVLPLK